MKSSRLCRQGDQTKIYRQTFLLLRMVTSNDSVDGIVFTVCVCVCLCVCLWSSLSVSQTSGAAECELNSDSLKTPWRVGLKPNLQLNYIYHRNSPFILQFIHFCGAVILIVSVC